MTFCRYYGAAILLVILSSMAGCGARSYSERLERTVRLQKHLQRLDRELVTKFWSGDGFHLRVPRQFSSVPEERSAKQLDAETTVPKRLRSMIAGLDGLHAVWRTSVKIGDRGERLPAFLVLASNRRRLQLGGHSMKDATQYEDRIVEGLFHACLKSLPLRRDWLRKELPESQEFAVTRAYSVFSLTALPAGGKERPYRVVAYCGHEGSRQFILLFLLPEEIAESEKLTQAGRIGSCLGTLSTGEE